MTVSKSTPVLAAILGLTAALGLVAAHSVGAQEANRDHQRHERRKGLDKVEHIVFIVKENRTFDNYFGTFPGADGATSGTISTGEVIPLRHAPDMTPRDIDHHIRQRSRRLTVGPWTGSI
jgi:phospholipase C